MNLLLHCCCAPCSVSCVKALWDEKTKPCLFWYNPNIHPYTEYETRRVCITEFADNENLELTLSGGYGLRLFLREISGEINESSEKRCEICYRIRLEKTAAFAAENGFSAFTTTLLISPYQNHDAVKRIAQEAAEKYKVGFFYRDFRPLFREGQAAARAEKMYMQKYCGCIFSEEERYSNENKSDF